MKTLNVIGASQSVFSCSYIFDTWRCENTKTNFVLFAGQWRINVFVWLSARNYSFESTSLVPFVTRKGESALAKKKVFLRVRAGRKAFNKISQSHVQFSVSLSYNRNKISREVCLLSIHPSAKSAKFREIIFFAELYWKLPTLISIGYFSLPSW